MNLGPRRQVQDLPGSLRDDLAHPHGHCIPNLPHAFGPRAGEVVPVKRLQSGRFSRREVSDLAVQIPEGVLSTRYTMDASL